MTVRHLSIMFDDAGRDFACYGSPDLVAADGTPEIDAIAAAGTMFENYRTLYPVCSPSRITFVTGQSAGYSWVNHADNWSTNTRQWMVSGASTIWRAVKTTTAPGETLPPHTLHVGKWHCGTPGEGRNTLHPTKFGIDRFRGNVHGYPNSAVPDFARARDTWIHDSSIGGHILTTGHVSDIDADFIVEWLDTYGLDPRGFLATWWLNAPHIPNDTTLPQRSMYSHLSSALQTYLSTMTHADEAIGRVVAKLVDLDIYDDTHITITSDNGPISPGWNGDRRGAKDTLWEAGVNLPFIWKGPGIPEGVVDTEHRQSIDWFVTTATHFGFDASGWPGADMFEAAPVRDMGFRKLGSNPSSSLIRTIGDGRTIKVVRTTVDEFYCIDTTDGEEPGNILTVVASGAVAGQLNQSDATSMSAARSAYVSQYPALDEQSFPPFEPVDETDMRERIEWEMSQEPRLCDYRVWMCQGSAPNLTALQSALATIAAHPRTLDCDHGLGDLVETALGTLPTSDHPTYDDGLVVSSFLHEMCWDPARRALLSPSELEEIDARLATTIGRHVI